MSQPQGTAQHDTSADLGRLIDEGYEITFTSAPGRPGYLATLTGPLGSTAHGTGKTPGAALRSAWSLGDDSNGGTL